MSPGVANSPGHRNTYKVEGISLRAVSTCLKADTDTVEEDFCHVQRGWLGISNELS